MIVELVDGDKVYFITPPELIQLKEAIVNGKKLVKLNGDYVPTTSILRITAGTGKKLI